ncbi:very short patch repair endonuclease [Planctellipticum variicoloris]|uniref:very short patch repair endonuclease n=1 Tax=Planctellipticum variicoloris TaxID=3064265 RepID=UPI003013EF1E|nr:very short patch repair endonuclease [Planctomycetaceae bacterium SH412]
MTDVFTPSQRSAVMRSVRGADTKPELVVRRELHRRGYRFRLHRLDLPGCPDLVFPKLHAIIFVHGCFWHRHACPAGRSMPASRVDYWKAKFERNQQRDRVVRRALHKAGWRVLVVWECQLTKSRRLRTIDRIAQFLDSSED